MAGGEVSSGNDGDTYSHELDATSLIGRYDTLHRLSISHGERGRGLYMRHDAGDARAGEALLILPSSSLLHAINVKGLLAAELLPTPERPSHAAHWDAAAGEKNAGQCALPLTSVQALTLVLAQWRARHDENPLDSSDDHLAKLKTFLSTYPSSYAGLPLHWQLFVDADPPSCAASKAALSSVLDNLPVHVGEQAKDVHRRFKRDIGAIQAVQLHQPEHLQTSSSFTVEHLAWAWAGVNSRCVYLPLGLKPHGDNFTLAPLLDMANHTIDVKRECKVRWLPTKALQLSAPTQMPLTADAEVCISYGPHANGFLLSEYGFTIPTAFNARENEAPHSWQGNPYAEVHVDHIVVRMLEEQGTAQCQLKRNLLDEEGYWGQYTIHPYKTPAHPSYRLVLALRLLALDLETGECDVRVGIWRANVRGMRDNVGSEAENVVRSMLSEVICASIMVETGERIAAIRSALSDFKSPSTGASCTFGISPCDVRAAAETVVGMLEEEKHIAQLLQRAIARGETDW